jgi:hypothetical protein
MVLVPDVNPTASACQIARKMSYSVLYHLHAVAQYGSLYPSHVSLEIYCTAALLLHPVHRLPTAYRLPQSRPWPRTGCCSFVRPRCYRWPRRLPQHRHGSRTGCYSFVGPRCCRWPRQLPQRRPGSRMGCCSFVRPRCYRWPRRLPQRRPGSRTGCCSFVRPRYCRSPRRLQQPDLWE